MTTHLSRAVVCHESRRPFAALLRPPTLESVLNSPAPGRCSPHSMASSASDAADLADVVAEQDCLMIEIAILGNHVTSLDLILQF